MGCVGLAFCFFVVSCGGGSRSYGLAKVQVLKCFHFLHYAFHKVLLSREYFTLCSCYVGEKENSGEDHGRTLEGVTLMACF